MLNKIYLAVTRMDFFGRGDFCIGMIFYQICCIIVLVFDGVFMRMDFCVINLQKNIKKILRLYIILLYIIICNYELY